MATVTKIDFIDVRYLSVEGTRWVYTIAKSGPGGYLNTVSYKAVPLIIYEGNTQDSEGQNTRHESLKVGPTPDPRGFTTWLNTSYKALHVSGGRWSVIDGRSEMDFIQLRRRTTQRLQIPSNVQGGRVASPVTPLSPEIDTMGNDRSQKPPERKRDKFGSWFRK